MDSKSEQIKEPTVEAALIELREMFPDAKFVTISGDYTSRYDHQLKVSTRIQVGGNWKTETGGRFFTSASTLAEAMDQVRKWKESQQ